jgi:hypothetical protein
MERSRPGYILLITIGIIAVLSLLVARMSTRTIVFSRLNSVLMRREQAKLVALSGVDCVIAQLLAHQAPEKSEAKGKTEGIELRRRAAILAVVKTINQWIPFSFAPQQDGIGGSCLVYVSCEDGKLGQEFFFDTHTMKRSSNPLVAKINQKAESAFSLAGRQIDLAKTFERLIQSKQRCLVDITELLDDERMKFFSRQLFMRQDTTFALSDLCSIDRKGFLLQPWALSKTVASLFGWKALTGLAAAQNKEIEELFRLPEGSIPLAKLCAVLYGEKRQEVLQEITSLFHQRFEANSFSIISYGSYEDIVVKMCVIIERQRIIRVDKNTQDQFFIKKIYWL